MTVETVNFICDLDPLLPGATDPVAQGDDHIRNLKVGIKATFPGEGGDGYCKAITATEDELNTLTGIDTAQTIQEQFDGVTGSAIPLISAPVVGDVVTVNADGTLSDANVQLIDLAKLNSPIFVNKVTIPDGVDDTDAASIGQLNALVGDITEAVNGSITLGGITMKWGVITTASSGGGREATVTYPAPFTSATFHVQLTQRDLSANQVTDSAFVKTTPSASGFTLRCDNDGNEVYWFAIGD